MELGAQDVAEQRVDSVRRVSTVERDQEQARLRRVSQLRRRIVRIEHRVARRSRRLIEDGRVDEELAHLPRQLAEELVPEVVRDEAVVARELRGSFVPIGRFPDRKAREVETRRPSFRSLHQQVERLVVEVDACGRKEFGGLVGVHRQARTVDRDEPVVRGETADGHRSSRARGEYELRAGRCAVCESAHDCPRLPAVEKVHVVEHQHERAGHAATARSNRGRSTLVKSSEVARRSCKARGSKGSSESSACTTASSMCTGSSCSFASASQATGRGSSWSHCEIKVVLPKPAPAATSTTGTSVEAWRCAMRGRRRTRPRRIPTPTCPTRPTSGLLGTSMSPCTLTTQACSRPFVQQRGPSRKTRV